MAYVNTGSSRVYDGALKEGLFDFMFVQDYNSGSNYVNEKGDVCNGK